MKNVNPASVLDSLIRIGRPFIVRFVDLDSCVLITRVAIDVLGAFGIPFGLPAGSAPQHHSGSGSSTPAGARGERTGAHREGRQGTHLPHRNARVFGPGAMDPRSPFDVGTEA
jgi:hypothetical protein